jgi:hypothetical protein
MRNFVRRCTRFRFDGPRPHSRKEGAVNGQRFFCGLVRIAVGQIDTALALHVGPGAAIRVTTGLVWNLHSVRWGSLRPQRAGINQRSAQAFFIATVAVRDLFWK